MTTEELTIKERMRRLTEKEPLDRIPVAGLLGLYASRISAIPFKEYWTNPQKNYDAAALAIEMHGFDDSPSYGYGWSDWIVTELGGEVRFSDNAYGLPSVIRRTVEKPSDVENLIFPKFGSGPVSRHMLECSRMNVANGGKASLQLGVTGVVGTIVGSNKMMRWFSKEPEAVHLLYRKVTDYLLGYIDLYAKEFGANNCAMSEAFPWDSQNLISPETFHKFGYVYTKEITQKVISEGITSPWFVHLCGNHMATLPLFKELPMPKRSRISIGSENDIKKVADYFGPDYIIYGNVPTQLLQFGTAEEVLAKCKEIIDQVKFHPGGFILGPACGMPPAAPPVNVHAMVKAAKLYGRYD
jgi:uroporphyrinogen decarboxylase